MEINARICVLAESEELLATTAEILKLKLPRLHFSTEVIQPSATLTLSRIWNGFAVRAGSTSEPDNWKSILANCAFALKKQGAVLIQFRSPDHPDEYEEYAYT